MTYLLDIKENDICMDCVRWRNEEGYRPFKNRSLYVYNDDMKGILAQFKFRGDAELVRIFINLFGSYFKSILRTFQLLLLFRLVGNENMNEVLIKQSY